MPYWHYQLVLTWYPHQPESHQLSLQNVLYVVCDGRTSGPIDRTPGLPGSDKNVFIYNFAGYTQQAVGLSGGDSDRGVIENYEKNLSNSPQVDFTASLAVSSPARYPHFLIE